MFSIFSILRQMIFFFQFQFGIFHCIITEIQLSLYIYVVTCDFAEFMYQFYQRFCKFLQLFYVDDHIIHKYSFTSSSSCPLFFSCLTALQTPRTKLNRSGKSKHPFFFFPLSYSCSWKYMIQPFIIMYIVLAAGFLQMPLVRLWKFYS